MSVNAWRLAPKGVKVLYASSLLMNMGFFALIPYLSLYLTGSFSWSMAMAGILLGVRQFSQQGLTFVGGIIADRLGCKETLVMRQALFIFSLASCAYSCCLV